MRRRGMGRRNTGLLGTAARTAVIAKTATRVSGREAARQAAEHAPPAPAQPPASDMSDVISQLKQLGELRDAGVLTDDEFAAKKAQLL